MLSTVKQKTVVFSSSKKHGFTLVEIIVACAVVIALFAGAVFIGHNLLENGKYNASLILAHDIAVYFGKTIEEIFLFEED